MSKDYYASLGLARGASKDEIKKAFRTLAHQHHPDKGGDAEKFKEINEAYQVLSDDQKRQQYDQFGSAAFDGSGGGGGFNWQDFARQAGAHGQGGVEFDFGNIGDIFGDFFGGGTGRAKHGPQRGRDIQVTVDLNFMDTVLGVEKTITLHREILCAKCAGNKAEPGTKIETCKDCSGAGQVKTVRNTMLGQFATMSVCTACQGEGKIPIKKCTACSGLGFTESDDTLTVSIPAGIDDGETIRVRAEANVGRNGGAPGDLYVTVHVKRDEHFDRSGSDVLSTETITFAQAVLGDKIFVKTVDGDVKLKIPSGTTSGQVFRLKGRGIPKLRGYGRGDHQVTVVIDVPKNISKKQKQLLEDFLKDK